MQVSSADAYASLLSGAGISLGLQARRDAIWAGVTAAAASAGGHVPESARGDLLDEVTNLVSEGGGKRKLSWGAGRTGEGEELTDNIGLIEVH